MGLRALIRVTVSWVYTYLQTHKIVHINYAQLFVDYKKKEMGFFLKYAFF